MCERRSIPTNEDPVCGTPVDVESARWDGLAAWFEDVEYVFCRESCLAEFREEPEAFLRSAYVAVL